MKLNKHKAGLVEWYQQFVNLPAWSQGSILLQCFAACRISKLDEPYFNLSPSASLSSICLDLSHSSDWANTRNTVPETLYQRLCVLFKKSSAFTTRFPSYDLTSLNISEFFLALNVWFSDKKFIKDILRRKVVTWLVWSSSAIRRGKS